MKLNKAMTLTLGLLAAALATGCDRNPKVPDMPQVNNENCKPENVAKVDAGVRQPFADACFRHGSYKPSSGMTY